MSSWKESIHKSFSESVDYYDRHAELQKDVALRLARALEPWQYSVPEGPILETGAGTGFFSEHLVSMFPEREVTLSDLSEAMVSKLRSKFSEKDHIKFKILDAETVDWNEDENALIAGNFVAQWFKDPSQTLSGMASSLKPGGFMLVSFPGSESYPQWKKHCLELGLPFTGNPLPDVEQIVVNLSMGPFKVDYYEDQSTQTFNDVYDFFSHLKKGGTATPRKKSGLTLKQLRLLNDHWLKKNNGKVTVHTHTAFIAVKKDL
ncbi:MAG: methyltransferase domain-containing protein [Balneolaceae bacterium]